MSGQGLAEVQRGRALEQLTIDLGAAIMDALRDPKVVEVMLNPDGKVWVDRLGEGMRCMGPFSGRSARSVIETTAGILDRVVNEDYPILECRLPLDGSRFEAVLPPLSDEPVFTIRKKSLRVFTFDDYVSTGIMSAEQRRALEEAVRARRNILVCGSTGSGKTTLANAVLDCIARQDKDGRVVVIEDTPELQVAIENTVYLQTAPRIDQTVLLKVTMRMRPDRIVVGEVRDGAALALLKAWNTGHPGGVGTVHANDSKAALIRIGQLVQEAGVPEQPELIAEAVNVIVFIARTPTGRRVEDVTSVIGWSRDRGYEVAKLA